MWTETVQLQVAKGLAVPIGASTGQTEDLVGDGFAAVFGQPVAGASAEATLEPKGDAPEGFGWICSAIPLVRKAGPSVDVASTPGLARKPAELDATPFGSRQWGTPGGAGLMTQIEPSISPHQDDQGQQSVLSDSASVQDGAEAVDPARPGSTSLDQGIAPFQMAAMAEETAVAPVERTWVAGGLTEMPMGGSAGPSSVALPELPPQASTMAQSCRPGPHNLVPDVAGVAEKFAIAPPWEPVEAAGDHVLSMQSAGLALAAGIVEPQRTAAGPHSEVVAHDEGKTLPSRGSEAGPHVPGREADHLKTGNAGAGIQTEVSEPKATDVSQARWHPAAGVPEVADFPEPVIVPSVGQETPETSGMHWGNQMEEAIQAGPMPVSSSGPDVEPDQSFSMAMDGSIRRPVLTLASTEAERLWLGRMHWQEDYTFETRRSLANDAVTIRWTEASGVFQRGRPDPVLALAEVSATTLVGPESQLLDNQGSLVSAETELAPMAWSPSGQPVLVGSPLAGPVPAGAMPQLAAVIVASLHHRVDGTTEIALSPDELGNVLLRLEADARDPDRIIVHLVFDRPETMDLFRRHADQLSEAIRAAGYADVRLDFGQHWASANSGSGQDASDGRTDTDAATVSGHGPIEQAQNSRLSHRLADAAGLDLRL